MSLQYGVVLSHSPGTVDVTGKEAAISKNNQTMLPVDSADLASWLRDVAVRPFGGQPPGAEEGKIGPEDLLQYLEARLGTRLQSRSDVDAFLNHLAETRLGETRKMESRRIIRETILLSLLSLSFLHYYFWDVHLKIASMQSVTVFARPVPGMERFPAPSLRETRT